MPQAPVVEVIPRRAAVCRDESVTLDVLVRITPPQPEVHFPRPALNLALVLDRSGSMAGRNKMTNARQAAVFAVEQLLPTDRLSLTVFDEHVDTLVTNAPVVNKAELVRQIQRVLPRGCTDLHGGWLAGLNQARAGAGLDGAPSGQVSRVLLLSDGLANAGLTDPNAIASEVRGAAAQGVTTTTMGVGLDYNEDLLESMARAGDGRYYHVETATQLADIFQTELQGLMATTGQKVSLGVEPAAGVTVADVLNDLPRTSTGRLMLPNLVVGLPVPVVVRLRVPAGAGAGGETLCRFRLAWDDPSGGPRCVVAFELRPLPAVARAAWDATPEHPDVREQEAVLMAARAQLEAGRAMERGDAAAIRSSLDAARAIAQSISGTSSSADLLATLGEIEQHLADGNLAASTKQAKFSSYSRSHGYSDRRPPKP